MTGGEFAHRRREQLLDGEPYYGTDILRWIGKGKGAAPVPLEVKEGEAAMVTAISNEGMLAGAQFDWSKMEAMGDYKPLVWDPNGKVINVPVDEYDATSEDIAGGWVLVSGKSNNYRWKFNTDAEPDRLKGFSATSVDELGRAYGAIGEGAEAVPGDFDTRPRPLPVPDGPPPTGNDETDYTGAAADGSVLVGDWKGNPVKWTCDVS